MKRSEKIMQLLTLQLQPLHIEIENESYKHAVPAESETHFKVLVVSSLFEGRSRLDRQRLVNDILKFELSNGLHALTQRALTPQEWEMQGAKVNFESPECRGQSKVNKA